jgi:hypothetical protein
MPFTDEAATRVAASECSYQPTVARIEAGQAVTFHNKDTTPHTFTGVLQSWGNYAEYHEGESVSYSFGEPGVYPYFCELHPGMAGAIVVGDGSAAADRGPDSGVSAVSAVSGGQAAAPAAQVAPARENEGGPTVAIVAAVGLLGAVLGLAVVAPLVVRRMRTRAQG